MSRRLALVLSVALVIAALPPWIDFRDHTHWDRVAWIPFVSPPVRLRDIVINLCLFAPLGASIAANVSTRARLTAVVVALVLSVAGEYTQLYSHGRFPSMTDVVCNVVGAGVAAHAVWRRRRQAA